MTSTNILAVVTLSGGMDSCVTLAHALNEGCEVAVLHADYGQRTEGRERQAFRDIAHHYQIPAHRQLVVPFGHLSVIGGSSLLDIKTEIPAGDLHRQGVPSTYVPFRNAHLLSTATSWAEVLGASRIYVGFVQEDSSGYPDCTESFLASFEKTAQIGTKPDTQLSFYAPLLHQTKKEIVQKGMVLKAPFHLTWSCYQQSQEACGRCDSCLLRLRGFHEAGLTDPLPYSFRPQQF